MDHGFYAVAREIGLNPIIELGEFSFECCSIGSCLVLEDTIYLRELLDETSLDVPHCQFQGFEMN